MSKSWCDLRRTYPTLAQLVKPSREIGQSARAAIAQQCDRVSSMYRAGLSDLSSSPNWQFRDAHSASRFDALRSDPRLSSKISLTEENRDVVTALAQGPGMSLLPPLPRVADSSATDTATRAARELPALPSLKPSSSFPAIRLTESRDYVTVTAVVPGFAESDLDITLAKDVLSISGRHRAEVPAGFSALHQSRRATDFRSEIKLLNDVAWDDTEARLERGVLMIRLRKDAPSSRPPIPIRLT
jgi:HSP20 family protein